MLLAMAEENDDQALALYKELQPEDGERAQLEKLLVEVRKAFPIGTVVDIMHTGYTGEVIKYNEALGGFYPGIRYPVKVKIIKKDPKCKHNVIGSVFEYTPDQLMRLDFLEQTFNEVDNNQEPSMPDNTEYMRCYDYWKNS